MKLFLYSIALSLSFSAFADIDVNCSAPAGFAGQAAVMKGTLKTSAKPQAGYFIASGSLKILIGGSSRNALYSKTVKVRGPILADGSLTMSSEKNPELNMIYVNTSRSNVSYVELDGKMFVSNCK